METLAVECCGRGHPQTEENTYAGWRGYRCCVLCAAANRARESRTPPAPRPDLGPTDAPPGSEEKLAVLTARAEARAPLFLEGDATLRRALRPLPTPGE